MCDDDGERAAVVVDNGSLVSRAGFAGCDSPSAVLPSVVATRCSGPRLGEVVYAGEEAKSRVRAEPDLRLKRPLESGIVTSWDYMEKLWHHIFHDKLCVNPEEHPLLLTEEPLNPKANREKTTEIMFETFKMPSLYLGARPVLSLFDAGQTEGTVFHSSETISYSIPVYEGHTIPHSHSHEFMAGRDVTDSLMRCLNKQGYTLATREDYEIVRDMKEKLCYVATDYEQEIVGFSPLWEKTYELPDGKVVTIGKERFQCPEGLFQPSLLDMNCEGIHEIIYRSIMKCDVEFLYSSIVLTGGSTKFPGFVKRMKKEITGLTGRVRVSVITPKDRDHSAWRGGAILASLSTFQDMSVSKQEYEEFGPLIVHRKCF